MKIRPSNEFLLLFSLVSSSLSTSLGSASSGSSFSSVIQQISRHGQTTWSRSTNVVQQISRRGQASLTRSIPALSLYSGKEDLSTKTLEVASVKKRKRKIQIPKEQIQSGGFYYGVNTRTMAKATAKASPTDRKPKWSESTLEALEELKNIRQEMETMRKEIKTLRSKMIEDGDLEENQEEMKAKQRKRQKR